MTKILIVDDVEGWRVFHKEQVNKLFTDAQIDVACSATEAYSKILENITQPYEIVITDLQMEQDYTPKYAGEWLIEQVQSLSAYYKTKIVIISATYNINHIADHYNVDYIKKSVAINSDDAYTFLQF